MASFSQAPHFLSPFALFTFHSSVFAISHEGNASICSVFALWSTVSSSTTSLRISWANPATGVIKPEDLKAYTEMYLTPAPPKQILFQHIGVLLAPILRMIGTVHPSSTDQALSNFVELPHCLLKPNQSITLRLLLIGSESNIVTRGKLKDWDLVDFDPRSQKGAVRTRNLAFVGGILIGLVILLLISTNLIYLVRSTGTPVAPTATTGTAFGACAAAPMLIGPLHGQTLNTRTVTLTWKAPQGCVPDGYTVRISADLDPEARPWIVDTGWAPTDYTYTFSTDGTYYWHIRDCQPCTPFNPGNWAIHSFTIHT